MILQTPELGFLVQTVPSPSSRTGWSPTFGLFQQQMRTTGDRSFVDFGCLTTQFWVSWCWLCNNQPVNVLFSIGLFAYICALLFGLHFKFQFFHKRLKIV